MPRAEATGRPTLALRCRGLLAVLGFGAACTAAGGQRSVRDAAEAWASALAAGDAKAYLAAVDVERATYVGRLVSSDSTPHAFQPADEARAVSALLSETQVISGDAKVAEVAGDEAVVDVKLDLRDTYAKGGAWQFRYVIAARVRLRTAVRDGVRRVAGIDEAFDADGVSRPLGSLALAMYLHSDLYRVHTIRAGAEVGRALEAAVIVDRRTQAPVVHVGRTFGGGRSPPGSAAVEEHAVLVEVGGRKIENVEEVE